MYTFPFACKQYVLASEHCHERSGRHTKEVEQVLSYCAAIVLAPFAPCIGCKIRYTELLAAVLIYLNEMDKFGC